MYLLLDPAILLLGMYFTDTFTHIKMIYGQNDLCPNCCFVYKGKNVKIIHVNYHESLNYNVYNGILEDCIKRNLLDHETKNDH